MTRSDLAADTPTGVGLTLNDAWHRLTEEPAVGPAVTATNPRKLRWVKLLSRPWVVRWATEW